MKNYKYKAFISYRHIKLDKTIAVKLQKMLETYTPPKGFAKKEKWHIFCDETEMAGSSDLKGYIKEALEDSQFLIVICSSQLKMSKWCVEEINYFKRLHNDTTENIIAFVVEGMPEQVIPHELHITASTKTDEQGNRIITEVEPLAANISTPGKKFRDKFLRIAAALLGCGFDDLYNREQRRKLQHIMATTVVITIFVTLFGIYNSIISLKLGPVDIIRLI